MAEEEATGAGARRKADGYLYLTLMVAISSTTAWAAKSAVRELPIGLMPPLRFGAAGLCLLPFIGSGGAGTLRRMLREDPVRLLLAAALCIPINQPFFLMGTKLAPTTHVGLIYATCPLVVLALTLALGQERLLPGRLAGIAACVLGVFVVGLDNLWQAKPESAQQLAGDLLLVGAVTSWGIYLTVSKPLVERHGAIPALAGTFLLGSFLYMPFAFATIPAWPTLGSVSKSVWWSFAYLTLGQSVFGLACQNQALRRFDSSQVAAWSNAASMLTILWGVWLLREPFTPALALGGLLTVLGIAWISRPAPVRAQLPIGVRSTSDSDATELDSSASAARVTDIR